MTSITELYGRGKAAFIVTTSTFILATLFVVARLISRFGILRHKTADDWVMVLAWVSARTLCDQHSGGKLTGASSSPLDYPLQLIIVPRKVWADTMAISARNGCLYCGGRNTHLRFFMYVSLAITTMAEENSLIPTRTLP